MTEFLDEILKVNSSLVLIKPNLSEMLNSTCRRELDSFNITTAGGEEKTTSIFGTMISRDNNTFNFTCTNLIEKDKSANITCRPTSKISTGTYHINQINFTTNDDKTNIKEAFLSGDTDSEISINTDFVPFIGQPPTNIEIDYDKSNSFTLEFNSSINEEAIPTILFAYNNEEIPINCSFVNALANCTIEDPSLIVSDQRYQVVVLDVCGAKTKTNITIDTKNLLLGTVHFDKSEIKCTDKLSNFNITISDHKINADNIEGTFINDDYNELTFTCSEITKKSEYLSCSSNTHNSDLSEGSYTLFNVNYKIQNTDEVLSAELTDTQSSFYYKSTYNKFIPGNNHNVTLNLSSDNSFNLSFTKKINTNKKITFKTPSGFSEILECVPNSSDNTILTCKNPDGNGKTLPQGTYTIHYENECKKIENPDFIVTVINETKPSAQFIVGAPSFSDTNECKSIESLKKNPNFTISNVYSTVTLQNIIGIVKSTINDKDTIEFTCGDIISGTLTCSFKGDNFNPGRYTLEFVQGISNQEPIDAHLNNKITFMDLADTYVPFTPKNEKQFITSNNQKVNITFDSELSSKVYCISIETNTKKEKALECDINHTNKKILECDVSILTSNSYNIYYVNECTVRINTGITIYINKAMAMIFDSPVFPSSSCTNTIDTFTINYIGEYIYNTGLTIYLTHTNNIYWTYLYNCYYSTNFTCTRSDTSVKPKNGLYYLGSISYSNSANNKEEGIITNSKSVVEYNSNYIELGIQSISQTIDFLTNSNITINFQSSLSDLLPVSLNETTLNNCSIKGNSISCQIDNETFNTNANYSVYITDACGKKTNTGISLKVQHLETNNTYDPGLDELSNLEKSFYDPSIDHNSYLHVSFMLFGIFIILI